MSAHGCGQCPRPRWLWVWNGGQNLAWFSPPRGASSFSGPQASDLNVLPLLPLLLFISTSHSPSHLHQIWLSSSSFSWVFLSLNSISSSPQPVWPPRSWFSLWLTHGFGKYLFSFLPCRLPGSMVLSRCLRGSFGTQIPSQSRVQALWSYLVAPLSSSFSTKISMLFVPSSQPGHVFLSWASPWFPFSAPADHIHCQAYWSESHLPPPPLFVLRSAIFPSAEVFYPFLSGSPVISWHVLGLGKEWQCAPPLSISPSLALKALSLCCSETFRVHSHLQSSSHSPGFK